MLTSIAQQTSIDHKWQFMDFHLHASAFGIVFNLLLIYIDLPSASSIFQHLQIGECYSDTLVPGDLGEERVFTLKHNLLQLDGRVWKEENICVFRIGGDGGEG